MTSDLARNWWVLLVRGLLAIGFGVLALINPVVTLGVLVLCFAAFAIVDGIFSIALSITARKQFPGWGWLLAAGIAGIVIGVLTFLWPGVTALLLLYWMLAWLVVTGIFQIVAGIRLRKEITGEFWVILGGVLSVLFGVFLMANPVVGALAVLWMIGFFALAFGLLMIFAAFRVRSFRGGPDPTASAHAV